MRTTRIWWSAGGAVLAAALGCATGTDVAPTAGGGAPADTSAGPVVAGETALRGLDGSATSLAALTGGRPAILAFFATW